MSVVLMMYLRIVYIEEGLEKGRKGWDFALRIEKQALEGTKGDGILFPTLKSVPNAQK
ncbi:MAG: hypothetical protein K5989_12390 [Lachnospiraceae bacterium]|nr:hypothetical protein [Lachnospiraceae bacterium]